MEFVVGEIAHVAVSVGPVVGALARTAALDEVAVVVGAALPVVGAFAGAVAVDELAFVTVSVGPLERAAARAFPFAEIAFVAVAVLEEIDAAAVPVSVEELAFVTLSVDPVEGALSGALVIDEIADVFVSVFPCVGALPVAFVVEEFAFVAVAVVVVPFAACAIASGQRARNVDGSNRRARHCGRRSRRGGARRRGQRRGCRRRCHDGRRVEFQRPGDRFHQFGEVLFGVGKGREPVLAAEVVVELVAHARIVGDEGDDDLPVVERLVDLVEHVLRCVGVVGIDQHDDLAVADAADDFAGVGLSGQDVARGDPAGDAVLFQRVAERIGQLFVFTCVTDKNVVCHEPSIGG